MILSEALKLPVDERVRRGEAFLDRELPGWETYIDREGLCMSSSTNCILGQLARSHPAFADTARAWDYDGAVNHLDPTYNCGHPWAANRDEWPVDCGFQTPGAIHGDPVTYADLAAAWRGVLERRQAQFAVRPGSTPPVATASAEEDFVDDMMDRPIYDSGQ